MNDVFLFDVDGTLTVAKQNIVPSFEEEFLNWMHNKEVYIVSGGTFERILGQLGTDILNKTSGIFACMGNAFLQKATVSATSSSYFCLNNESGFNEWQLIYENNFISPDNLTDKLEYFVQNSLFPIKTGRHYEVRVGMMNFSVVGRNANIEQRKLYEQWDADTNERQKMVEQLKSEFDTLDFVIGGAVSMDIFNKGNDKSQIIDNYFKEAIESKKIHFVGDRIPFPGNDHTLAELLCAHPNGAAYEVETWEDTAKLLKSSPFV
jgi:phosphomannomutase